MHHFARIPTSKLTFRSTKRDMVILFVYVFNITPPDVALRSLRGVNEPERPRRRVPACQSGHRHTLRMPSTEKRMLWVDGFASLNMRCTTRRRKRKDKQSHMPVPAEAQ